MIEQPFGGRFGRGVALCCSVPGTLRVLELGERDLGGGDPLEADRVRIHHPGPGPVAEQSAGQGFIRK